MKEILDILTNIKEQTKDLIQRIDVVLMKKELTEYEKKMQEPDFWNDQMKAQTISKQVDELVKEIGAWEKLEKDVVDLIAIANEAEEDEELQQEIFKNTKEIQERFENMEVTALLDGKYDKNNAILSIHAGTGGVDAQDWAEMLKRMFLRFIEKKEWKAEILQESRGQEAGIKSLTIGVQGRNAYGYLQSEAGVHRLVRISPFNAEGMRHTSFALVEVLPEIEENNEVKIKDDDIEIDVFRASGKGGQGVNTTDSAVRVKHKPSGIVVTCQNERSQHQNKAFAMKILAAKLHKLQEEASKEQKAEIRGDYAQAEWGNQIRSYVLHPYQQVKDHRTKYEEKDPQKILDGELNGFIQDYLKHKKQKS